jgi:hypothetical protein
LDVFGSAGSILFKTFDISKLSKREICDLENDARLDWSVVGGAGGKFVNSLISRCLRSERRVAELVEENEHLRRMTEDIVCELKSSFATIEGEMEAARQSRWMEIETVAAAMKSKASEQVASLTWELGAMREAPMTFSVSATTELMKSITIELGHQQQQNDDLRRKFDDEHRAKREFEDQVGEQERQIKDLRAKLESVKSREATGAQFEMGYLWRSARVDLSRFHLGQEVSRGTRGMIYKARDRETGREVIVKSLAELRDPYEQKLFLRELLIPMGMTIPSVVKILVTVCQRLRNIPG